MEAIENIVAEMRKDIPRVVDAKVILRNYADRLEKAREFELAVEKSKAAGEGYAAGKQSVTDCNQLEMRKADSIHRAMVLIAGIEMENHEDPPRLWTALKDAWDALCDALGTDGDVSADVAEAKATGRHFVVKPYGNAAKMREALEYLRDASREFHHLILNSKHNEICDKYKYAEVAKISDAIANAGIVLSEPPRNCDRFADELDSQIEFLNDVWLISVTRDTMLEKDKFENWTEEMKSAYAKWLLAEAKGE